MRYLFDPSKFGVLGANDPWMKTFHKFLSEFCISPTIHVSWPNLAKIGHCKVAKKSYGIAYKKRHASETLFSPPFRHHLADRAQNFVKIVGPWPEYVYQLWSESDALCRTYSGNSPKKSIQYRLSADNKIMCCQITSSISQNKSPYIIQSGFKSNHD